MNKGEIRQRFELTFWEIEANHAEDRLAALSRSSPRLAAARGTGHPDQRQPKLLSTGLRIKGKKMKARSPQLLDKMSQTREKEKILQVEREI